MPAPSSCLISVIIPVLNEEKAIAARLTELRDMPDVEVIVVDGGSRDQTVDLAKASGVRVLSSLPGRARQMNKGARAAVGNILLFLHADTQLPDEFVMLMQQTLARSQVVAGAFKLHIASSLFSLRLVEWGVNWRSHLCQLPYGDQALFLQAATFHQLGGFPELPIMEDFVFVRQLRRLGRVAIAPASVTTSGRRWHKLGVWKTTVLNQMIIIAYFLGVPPQRLAQWYGAGLRQPRKRV